jgi:hypothetical protein
MSLERELEALARKEKIRVFTFASQFDEGIDSGLRVDQSVLFPVPVWNTLSSIATTTQREIRPLFSANNNRKFKLWWELLKGIDPIEVHWDFGDYTEANSTLTKLLRREWTAFREALKQLIPAHHTIIVQSDFEVLVDDSPAGSEPLRRGLLAFAVQLLESNATSISLESFSILLCQEKNNKSQDFERFKNAFGDYSHFKIKHSGRAGPRELDGVQFVRIEPTAEKIRNNLKETKREDSDGDFLSSC